MVRVVACNCHTSPITYDSPMTTGSLLLSLALLIVVLLFIARPFILPPPAPARLSEQQMLLAQKEALLAQIKALDFDAETGKLDEEDYAAEREMLIRQTMAVMRQLDEVADVEAEIEAAVERLRQTAAAEGETRPLNFCPQCGTAVTAQDRFCANCGHQLQPQRGVAA